MLSLFFFTFFLIHPAWSFEYFLAAGNSHDISFYSAPPENTAFTQPDTTQINNIIICIGDGMGPNHIALARQNAAGSPIQLWMECLPISGNVKTYSANNAVTDSAAAVTAIAAGVKTNNGVLGLTPDGTPYAAILELLSAKGWRTGLVATSTITHATPAGFAAHIKSRDSELQIAEQMLSTRVDILFGGGRKFWLPENISPGIRTDNKNLIESARSAGYAVVHTKEQLLALTWGPVLGLFADDAMTTHAPEPSLPDMAKTAITLLNTKAESFAPQPKFFLMVEGSQIDWAGHANDTQNCIRQTLLFDMAVKQALDFAVKDKNTLLIVTADHETGGLTPRENKDDSKRPTFHWTTKNHTAADVNIFAFGPGSQIFAGPQDNTDIAKKIAALMHIEPFPQQLTRNKSQTVNK